MVSILEMWEADERTIGQGDAEDADVMASKLSMDCFAGRSIYLGNYFVND